MIDNIKKIPIKYIPDERGDMIVLEKGITLDINFVRTFLVYGHRNINRGNHAHKKCSQLLIAINGKIDVICNDANKERKFVLSNPKEALLVPVLYVIFFFIRFITPNS